MNYVVETNFGYRYLIERGQEIVKQIDQFKWTIRQIKPFNSNQIFNGL